MIDDVSFGLGILVGGVACGALYVLALICSNAMPLRKTLPPLPPDPEKQRPLNAQEFHYRTAHPKLPMPPKG